MARLNICRHNLLRRSCETCDLEEEVRELKAYKKKANENIQSLMSTIDQLQKEYDKLDEQAERWREESGN